MKSLLERLASLPAEARQYNLDHLVEHLYQAQDWPRLFELLDTGQFGQAKIQYDPSMRSYAQDLDLGRKAATDEAVIKEKGYFSLAYLWRYSLLRCSLTNQVGYYTVEVFRFLLMLGRVAQTTGMVELLARPEDKAEGLIEIARHLLEQPGQEADAHQFLMRAYEIALNTYENAKISLAGALIRAQQWELAEKITSFIQYNDYMKASLLRMIAKGFAQRQQWERAEALWETIVPLLGNSDSGILELLLRDFVQVQKWERALAAVRSTQGIYASEVVEALKELGMALIHAQQWDLTAALVRSIQSAFSRFEVALALATALTQAHQGEHAERMWSEASRLAHLHKNDYGAEMLGLLGATLAQTQQWERAEQMWLEAQAIASTIEDPKTKSETLTHLGQALAQAHQMDRVHGLWSQAETVAHSIVVSPRKGNPGGERNWPSWEPGTVAQFWVNPSGERDWAFRRLGTTLAEAKQWERAREVIRSIEESKVRTQALIELGAALAQANQLEHAQILWSQAETTAHTLEDEHTRSETLSKLGTSLAQARQWERAREVILSIEESEVQTKALSEMGTLLVQAKQWERAEAIALSMEEGSEKIRALSELGIALVQAQQRDDAERVWSKLQAVTCTIALHREKIWALYDLLTMVIQTQQWDRAEALWRDAETAWLETEAVAQGKGRRIIVRGQDAWGPIRSERMLRELAMALMQIQQWNRAETIARRIKFERKETLKELGITLARTQQWNRAEAVIRSIENSKEKVEALCALAAISVKAQRQRRAKVFWLEAEKVAHSIDHIENPFSRCGALSTLGTGLAQAQQWKWAETLYDEVIMTARAVDAFTRSLLLTELGTTLAQAQHWEQANALWLEAAEAARTVKYSEGKARTLRELGTALAQVRRWEQADALWSEAETAAHSVEGSEQKALALIELGTARARAQRQERAENLWREAEAILHSLDNIPQRSRHWILRCLATSLAQVQQWERAETLAHLMWETEHKAETLQAIAESLVQSDKHELLFRFIQRSWLRAETREYCLSILSLAKGLIPLQPELATAFCEALSWVENFLLEWICRCLPN